MIFSFGKTEQNVLYVDYVSSVQYYDEMVKRDNVVFRYDISIENKSGFLFRNQRNVF